MKPVYYSDYLQLDKILNAQALESDKHNKHAHDEMLFVIIHQTYELWFKQLLYEVESVSGIFAQKEINDNSPDLQIAVHRLERCCTILGVLVQQIDVMETMTPMDFLDFRDLLRPASGFQSIQFKFLEALLGLKFEHRHGQNYYTSQLTPEDVAKVKELEQRKTLLELVNGWLERMPYFNHENLWTEYRSIYASSLQEAELNNLEQFDKRFFSTEKNPDMALSRDASRSALFIILYRHYPLLHLPYELIKTLLTIDELLGQWRFRHINMVQRIIGSRTGTGGSTGTGYLQAALNKHYIFKDFASLTGFLIERNKLPKLNLDIVNKMGFEQ